MASTLPCSGSPPTWACLATRALTALRNRQPVGWGPLHSTGLSFTDIQTLLTRAVWKLCGEELAAKARDSGYTTDLSPPTRHGVRFPPLSVHLSTIMYRLRCDVLRTIFVPKLCLCGQMISPYHAIFKCPALAGHFKPFTDKLRSLNPPPGLFSLCRFRDDARWGLAVDTAKLIFTSGVAVHI